MLTNLPDFVNWIFIATVILTALFFISAAMKGNSRKSGIAVTFVLAFWIISQSYVSFKGFYTDTTAVPPKFLFLAGPPFLLIILLFLTKSGRKFIDSLSLPVLTQLHVIRVFVEIVLYWIFIYKYIPQLMTFEGRNFDIVAGITAPIVTYLAFVRKKIGRNGLLAWNILALLLVINIMINGMLSAPFSFQKFAFDQPNIAVLYFPFTLLPGFIVPVVIFCHLVSMRRLLNEKRAVISKSSESEALVV